MSTRMLAVHERIGNAYESAAEAALQEQLTKAGARLAAVLNSIWPQWVWELDTIEPFSM
jgi:hypothetical protein